MEDYRQYCCDMAIALEDGELEVNRFDDDWVPEPDYISVDSLRKRLYRRKPKTNISGWFAVDDRGVLCNVWPLSERKARESFPEATGFVYLDNVEIQS